MILPPLNHPTRPHGGIPNPNRKPTMHPNAAIIMRPHFAPVLRYIRHHFANRHDGRGSLAARQWIAEIRNIEKRSGCKYNI